VARRHPAYAPRTTRTVELLGMEIARARRSRRITSAELAERAGISLNTLTAVEHGSTTVAIGTVFEVALLVGIDLLAEADDFDAAWNLAREAITLLPGRVRRRAELDDDF
jgi:transcriptional regulator with XRE-family HTH domain